MREELLKGLSEKQIAKVKACKDQGEILAIAKEEGIELTSEQLEAVSGGNCLNDIDCPQCGQNIDGNSCDDYYNYVCPHCGYRFRRAKGIIS
jgi:DNA-directed RNA polymerase subunit RPC12/RpoP